MSDYRVLWTHGNAKVEVDLIDKIGYITDYQFSDLDAVVPGKGEATNQTDDMVPLNGTWVMNNFDNSANYSADGSSKGDGVVKDIAIGTFPKGTFEWVVTKRL